jgi:hypothetical protein
MISLASHFRKFCSTIAFAARFVSKPSRIPFSHSAFHRVAVPDVSRDLLTFPRPQSVLSEDENRSLSHLIGLAFTSFRMSASNLPNPLGLFASMLLLVGAESARDCLDRRFDRFPYLVVGSRVVNEADIESGMTRVDLGSVFERQQRVKNFFVMSHGGSKFADGFPVNIEPSLNAKCGYFRLHRLLQSHESAAVQFAQLAGSMTNRSRASSAFAFPASGDAIAASARFSV